MNPSAVTTPPPVNEGAPTRLSAAVWRGKVTLLQIRRGVLDMSGGPQCYGGVPLDKSRFPQIIASSRTPLWSDETVAERRLQLGKVQNLRCAVRKMNGVVVPAGEIFSFWKQVGRTTARRGYAPGRELREGCVIPSLGGGLCQLSNALYQAALEAGADIVERHAHTRVVPGSASEAGRDATVFWNYRDLRFHFTTDIQIEAHLTGDELIVRFRATPTPREKAINPAPTPRRRIVLLDPVAHGCVTCGQTSCFRHESDIARNSRGEVAEKITFLLDEVWPEYQRYVSEMRGAGNVLGIAIDGTRWRLPRYAWDSAGFSQVETATVETLWRSLEARRLRGAAPAQVRAAQLQGAERLALRLAERALAVDTRQVVVAQTLLPFLWRDAYLGGRTFDVLVTRFPLEHLHARLDEALTAHPERRLLGDFRAPQWLVEAETEALAAATRIVTPHAAIAALFPGRAVLIPWHLPALPTLPSDTPRQRAIAFPGPTAARKGAYEVREAVRALDCEVVLTGNELEGADFWQGVRTRRVERTGTAWLTGVAAVVQPSVAEDQPRPLLRALAAGVPVVATQACGLGERPGVTTVASGNVEALIVALKAILPAA